MMKKLSSVNNRAMLEALRAVPMTGWLPRYPRWLRVFTAGAVVAAVMAGSAAAKAANYF